MDKDTRPDQTDRLAGPRFPSKKVTDHLANERTFLAWVRTAIAAMGFGFVVARFGLFLREISAHQGTQPAPSVHFSTFIGISLVILGGLILVMALVSFLHIRRAIDSEQFYSSTTFALILTVFICIVAIILAGYLIWLEINS